MRKLSDRVAEDRAENIGMVLGVCLRAGAALLIVAALVKYLFF